MPNKIQDLFGDWIQFDCPTDGVHYAIAVANRVWDPISMMWVSETQPGGGGGGGPATIADGADVAEGATTDAAVITDTTGTVSGKLRGLVKMAANNYGTWNYVSGTISSGSVTGSGKCIGIRVFAAGIDGSFNVNGGNIITVRNGAGVDINPGGNVVAPVVNWVSGTLDVVIEGLT
jgi:hypothetical protein